MDRQTNEWTDIRDSRVAFATENRLKIAILSEFGLDNICVNVGCCLVIFLLLCVRLHNGSAMLPPLPANCHIKLFSSWFANCIHLINIKGRVEIEVTFEFLKMLQIKTNIYHKINSEIMYFGKLTMFKQNIYVLT